MGMLFAQIDRRLAGLVTVEIIDDQKVLLPSNGESLAFQFPPMISSENKSSNWSSEGNATVAWEPITIWKGATAKKITFKAEYIVSDSGEKGWNAQRIDRILKEFKRINYGSTKAIGSIPNYTINLYNTVIGQGAQFKIRDVSVNYSETLVVDRSTQMVYPLKSELSFTGDLVTRINDKQQVGDIKTQVPKVEWY